MIRENDLKKIQAIINYKFKNEKLLQQAFTRASYSKSFGGKDNEVLEFFGDRILDYAVIKDFYDRFGKINNEKEFISSKSVGELYKLDVELVRNSNLSEQITRMGIAQYMQVFVQKEKKLPKNKADLFEAILGAIAIDSDWNLTAILNAYRSMMLYYGKATALLEELKDDYIDTFETLIWRHGICKTENKFVDYPEYYKCNFIMIINGSPYMIQGFGKSKKEATTSAYKTGSKIIYLIVEKKFIPDETYTEQLYFLFSQGFAPEPEFHFEYYPRHSNNTEELWRCYGSFAESENEFVTEDPQMSDAKEQACYAMLCEILGLNYEQNDVLENEPEQDYIASAPQPVIHGQGLLKYILSMYQNVA